MPISMEIIMATQELNEQTKPSRPVFTPEQHEAWKKAKLLLKTLMGKDTKRYRALHIAMSELRGRYRKHKGPIETVSSNPNKVKQRTVEDLWNNLRKKVDAWKEYFETPGFKKLYVITDNELSTSQQAVQSAHAVAKFQKDHPNAPWTNGTLVLLTPDSTNKVYKREVFGKPEIETPFQKFIHWYLKAYNFDYISYWREEDLDNQITSVVVLNDYNTNFDGISGIKLL